MQITKYEKLIPENIAPYNAKRISVYDKETNSKVGSFGLQNLRAVGLGQKLYSFGALSDIHLQYNTAQEDFQRALTYLNGTEDVAFTCICGDLTDNGEDADFVTYKNYINAYSPNTPVYECTGNHDAYDNMIGFDKMKPYTGHDLYYTFAHGSDVFIMFGTQYYDTTGKVIKPFSIESLQWLYETLEANRNKRVILFQHYLRFDGSGNPFDAPLTGMILEYCTEGAVFKSLMEHYTNVVWFHGHSHTMFELQEGCPHANYDRLYGCHSVHIPSLVAPKDFVNGAYIAKEAYSEGYVVDVYARHIVLRGRDFARSKFLPIAQYCLDTTLKTIAPNTYTDKTGTIKTH